MRLLPRRRRKLPRAGADELRLAQMLGRRGITLAIDVGANEGQYGARLREAGYAGRILSFEPGARAWAALSERAAGDALWDVAPRMALGAESGAAELGEANRSDMNSLLSATETTKAAFPRLRFRGAERVEVARLDAVLDTLARPRAEDRIFLKIDTQGYESRVLAGAENVLGRIIGLQLEMSLIPLYEGEADYIELARLARRSGYTLHLAMGGYFSRALARQLQIDGVFFRDEAVG